MSSRSNFTTALPMSGNYVDISAFLPPVDLDITRDPILLAWPPKLPLRVAITGMGVRLEDTWSYDNWAAYLQAGYKALSPGHVLVVSSDGVGESEPKVRAVLEESLDAQQATQETDPETQDAEPPTAKKPKTQKIKLTDIRLDGGTQLRAGGLDEDAVKDYVDVLAHGDKLPPVTVVFDGDNYWLVGGFHRLEAHERAGKRVIEAVVYQGKQRAAILMAVSENTGHGLRRTNADKRSAVSQLLGDPEWGQWTDRKIAEKCGVSQPFVSKLRKEPQSDNGYHPAEGDESEKTVAPPGDSANYAVPGNCDFGDFDQDDEDIEAEEDSQEDCNVDAVVDAAGAPTPVTEPQERESESSVSPNKAEAGGTEDAVSVDGAVDAAIAEPPQVELVTSDEASESEGEDDVEGEDTEDEEPDQEGEVGKDAPKKPIDPVDAWAVVLATVRQRPDLAPRLIKGLARAGGVYVAIEGAADEASETAIQRLQSQLLRQYARLADEDYEEASSLHERLFRDLQQVFLDRQPQDWGEEGEEDYED